MGFNTDFARWLLQEMNIQHLSQADVSKRSKLSSSVISNILNLQRAPGPATCNALAAALNLPPLFVFIKAGLIPEDQAQTPVVQEIIYKIAGLDPDKQQIVLDLINGLIARSEREAQQAGKK